METTKPIDSLYIHVPFCRQLCSYCDFPKLLYFQPFVQGYLRALKRQLEEEVKNSCRTIYVGGGTPSSLNEDEFNQLLMMISPYVNRNQPYEWTVEVNPETMTHKKMALLVQHGVNRLSIGVQTFQPHLVKVLSRNHTLNDIQQIVIWAKEFELTNYSFDFIYGIPGQTIDDIRNDLNILTKFLPPHVSLYSLTIEPHTPLYLDGVIESDEDILRDYYDFILLELRTHGYHRYEVSNFALSKELESQHNLTYWRSNSYYGIGPGAHGFDGSQRSENLRSFTAYFKGEYKKQILSLSDSDLKFEYLMLNLRLDEGISFTSYKQRFNEDFYEKFMIPIQALVKQGYIIVENDRIHVSDDGMMRLHYVILQLTGHIDL